MATSVQRETASNGVVRLERASPPAPSGVVVSVAFGGSDGSRAQKRNPVPSGPGQQSTQLFDALTRVIDIIGALSLLLFLAPLMIATALAVWAQDRRPPLFVQIRLSKGREFRCLKFRTMVIDAEARLAAVLACDAAAREEWARDHKLRRDPRVTRLGSFLRKTSLDEFPQLVNVLLGDMSLVGPRPIVRAEIAKYGHRFQAYSSVKPGLTGLWQVSGRNDVSYRRRIAMDMVYARNRCLRLYLAVLVSTIPAVLARRGAS